MNRLLKCFSILFIIFQIFNFNIANAAENKFPKLDQPIFAQDHANLMTEEDKNRVNEKGQELQDGTDADIMLMTMNSVGDTPRQDYALEAGRHYKVGDQEHNRGIVILLNLDNGNENNNRGIDVAVGEGLEGVLNDAKVGEMIDTYFMPYQQKAANTRNADDKKEYYSKGLTELYEAIWKEIADSYGYNGEEFTKKNPEPTNDGGGFSPIFSGLIIFFIISWIFFRNGGGKPPRGGPPGGRGRRTSGPIIIGGFPGGSSSGGGFTGGSFGGGGGFSGGGAGRGF